MERDYFDNIYYTASLVDYIARITNNKYCDVVGTLGEDRFRRLVDLADVYLCCSFEQVSYEIIERHGIMQGQSKTPSLHSKPTYLEIGKAYALLVSQEGNEPAQYWQLLYTYLSMPLQLDLKPDTEEAGYVASLVGAPGCLSCGTDVNTAVANVYDALTAWMDAALTYKGYRGSVAFSVEDSLFYGKVLDTKALISYEGSNINYLIADFHNAVDDYLMMCRDDGIVQDDASKVTEKGIE